MTGARRGGVAPPLLVRVVVAAHVGQWGTRAAENDTIAHAYGTVPRGSRLRQGSGGTSSGGLAPPLSGAAHRCLLLYTKNRATARPPGCGQWRGPSRRDRTPRFTRACGESASCHQRQLVRDSWSETASREHIVAPPTFACSSSGWPRNCAVMLTPFAAVVCESAPLRSRTNHVSEAASTQLAAVGHGEIAGSAALVAVATLHELICAHRRTTSRVPQRRQSRSSCSRSSASCNRSAIAIEAPRNRHRN